MLVAVLGGAVTLAASTAEADETVRLTTEANLRVRPGERAPTLAVLDEGRSVRVIGRQGRWVKVSYKGKVGWLTRTQVEETDDEAPEARATAEKKRTSKSTKARKGWSEDIDEDAVGGDAVDEEEAPPPKKKAVAKAEPKKAAKAKVKGKKVAKAEPQKGDEVVLTRSSTLRQKPSKKADELWEADEGAAMKVLTISDNGDWLRVQDQDGEKGWIAARDVEVAGVDDAENDMGSDVDGEGDDEGNAIARGDVESDEEDDTPAELRPKGKMARVGDEDVDADAEDMEDGDEEPAPKKVSKKARRGKSSGKGGLVISAHGNLGILSKSQTYDSAGTGLRAKYALANTAPAVIVGGGVSKDMGSYSLGAGLNTFITVGGSGIKLSTGMGNGMGGGGGGETLSWSALEVDAHGSVGYSWNKRKGYLVEGRVGYHISSVTVAVSEVAKLPSERLGGVSIGAGVKLPKLTDTIGVTVGANYLITSSLEQTEGLKDGDQSAVSALFVGAEGTYALRAKMDVHAYYQLNMEGYSFGGANQREATATGAKRQDVQHVLGVGLSYLF
jgi:uncharacterized protein YgiM (DUF1202 family)